MIGQGLIRIEERPRVLRVRIVVGLLMAAGVLLFALANTHLVYVAIESQPDCVPHVKQGGAPIDAGSFRAAKSAC
jgi:hypothetical protein